MSNRRTPPIIAHRGASYAAPENTLPAFALAWQEGADGIEGDFHLTADGRILCIHDDTTGRTCGENLVVREQPLAVLQQLDAGAWRGTEWRGVHLPTLEEILAAMPRGKTLEIEIKCGVEMLPPLAAVLAQQAAGVHITVICFKPQVIAASKQHLPQIPALWLAQFSGGSDDLPAKEVLKTLRECGADGLGSSPQIAEDTSAQVLTAGYRWGVWTVDEVATAQKLQQRGATSITTNVPREMREGLGLL